MGASIMAIPAIRYARLRHPEAEIYVLTTTGNRSSWEISGYINPENILCLDGRSLWRFIGSAAQNIVYMRRVGIDLVIDFEKFSRISTIISIFGGARRVAGFFKYEYEGLYRGSTLIDVPCSFNQNLHIAQNFLALTKAALDPMSDYPNRKEAVDVRDLELPKYSIDHERGKQLRSQLQLEESEKLVLIAPDVGGNLRVRNYPVESYARVAQHLLERDPCIRVALIGVKENQATCAQLQGLIGSKRCVNLCGETHGLHHLMELISISEILIGNDNGPLHFASLTSIKIVGIFSTDSPFMYGPLGECLALYNFFHCSPCISALNHKRSKCRDNKCIKSIPAEFVATMALRLLADEIPVRTVNGTQPYLLGQQPNYYAEPLVALRTSSTFEPGSREPVGATWQSGESSSS
jgi:ADP-heptose:LPS heptosyltransferase